MWGFIYVKLIMRDYLKWRILHGVGGRKDTHEENSNEIDIERIT